MEVPLYEVQKGESLAARRTIYIPMYAAADYVTPGTVVAGKAKLSVNGGTSTNSVNSMAAVTGHNGVAKLVLDTTEITTYGNIVVTAPMGASFGQALVRVVQFDPFTEGALSETARAYKAGK
jgi:hypothetical protein